MYPRLLHMGFVWVHALHQWTPYSTLSKHSVCFPRPVIYEFLILSFKSFLNRIFKVDFQKACNIIKQWQRWRERTVEERIRSGYHTTLGAVATVFSFKLWVWASWSKWDRSVTSGEIHIVIESGTACSCRSLFSRVPTCLSLFLCSSKGTNSF